MSLLLDTHVFLWFINGDKKLPASLRNQIKDVNQSCFLSVVSLWEITIKQQLGKLTLDVPLDAIIDYIDRNQIEIIPIDIQHLLTLSNLPRHHGDPFDRLIVSQAISEKLTLVSSDNILKKYKVSLLWK